MTTNVVVTGIGLLSCLGNLTQSWRRVLKGESGIGIYQPFPELPPLPMGLIAHKPITLTHLSKTLVSAALADADLTIPLPDCGVVIGSSRGCQGLWEQVLVRQQLRGEFHFSFPWLQTLPHQAAIATARQIGTDGSVLAPMAACATGIWAIFQAVELIQQGCCQRAIAGAVETPITPLTVAGFEKMGALAAKGCYPFDREREGLVLGEGGAILVLESQQSAQERGAFIYGQILGCGLSCDAHHLSAPAKDNYSAIRAIKDCLERSSLSPYEIDYIHAHGTSTRLNDARESQLIEQVFGTYGVAVSSTKGATGHSLGASGVMGIAYSLMALKEQILPPCVGLNNPAFPLDLVTQARPTSVHKVLCFCFGFGGQNGVIALSRNN
jgi:3-oxoacyl-[acyl-carrier-protein] synthase II